MSKIWAAECIVECEIMGIMSKRNLFFLVLVVILATACLTLILNSGQPKTVSKSELEVATNQAKYFYQQRLERGEDFSSGPCLSDALMPGWVVDIVHQPRQAIDDLPENQCPSFIEGRAKHFVELDTLGNLVRIQ